MTKLKPCPFCGNREPGIGWCTHYKRDHNDQGEMIYKSEGAAGVWCPCGANV